MRIISNKRYRKLRELELKEEVIIMRVIPEHDGTVEDMVRYEFETNNLAFLRADEYANKKKKVKGEIGMMFGKRIILK